MRYINKLNGAVIDVTVPISGENWEKMENKQIKIKDVKQETDNEIKAEVNDVEDKEGFDLTKLTVKELKAYAKSNDIELPSEATKKDEIIEVIATSFQD
ncbi:hypothetical protein SAMN04488558_10397 [Ignavigranum ruoffiae]|uniref:Rho termination factor, N-terminal domain n=1 Tax=Ignavigranum ruoffiae TaxID=89093 RepID=A0A1H9BTI4_9LACT|nr:Rho termination factor N-terminal domain-containing protein [Ignavigranum ruoffiae]SEP92179.1 hypothetical protein SAMN04488558_10397 [Ignavigranum ruoffiae]